jgi:alpha-glucosidase
MSWLPADTGVLWLGRGDGQLQLMANLSPAPVNLPAGVTVLLASGPLPGGKLPPDTAVWLRATEDQG